MRDMEEYKQMAIDKAVHKLSFKSNDSYSDVDSVAVLDDFYEEAIDIVKKWRKLKDDTEFLEGKWVKDIANFIYNSVMRMRDEQLESSNINGVNKKYATNPEAILKADVKYVMF